MVVVVGENVLHHVEREGANYPGGGTCPGGKCPDSKFTDGQQIAAFLFVHIGTELDR